MPQMPCNGTLIKISPSGPLIECFPHSGATAFLFYPGTMIEPGHYALFINALYQSGFSVYALHLAGHGKNTKKVRDFPYMLQEGLKAQDWLLKNASSAVVVGGHSQGGICALAQGTLSDRLSAVFAFGSCLPQQPSAIEATRFAKFSAYREKILHFITFLSRLLPSLPVPLPVYLSGRKVLAGVRRPILTGEGRTRISYPIKFLASLFSYKLGQKLLCPLWLFSARGDAIFTENITRETFARISAPKKFLVSIPDGGHLAILNPWLAKYMASICACATLSLDLPLNTASEKSPKPL